MQVPTVEYYCNMERKVDCGVSALTLLCALPSSHDTEDRIVAKKNGHPGQG